MRNAVFSQIVRAVSDTYISSNPANLEILSKSFTGLHDFRIYRTLKR